MADLGIILYIVLGIIFVQMAGDALYYLKIKVKRFLNNK